MGPLRIDKGNFFNDSEMRLIEETAKIGSFIGGALASCLRRRIVAASATGKGIEITVEQTLIIKQDLYA
jgi:hypothetical protein